MHGILHSITVYQCKYKSISRKEKGQRALSPIALLHNLIFIDTRYQRNSGFLKVNLSGGVCEAHGEDFSFEPFCLPVHSAGGLAESWFLTHCQLMSCDRSIRRPLFFSGGLLVGALQVGYNQRVMDKCPAVHGAQTKTPRFSARRLERKTRRELFLVIHWKSAI